jgi:hypothetical protein
MHVPIQQVALAVPPPLGKVVHSDLVRETLRCTGNASSQRAERL